MEVASGIAVVWLGPTFSFYRARFAMGIAIVKARRALAQAARALRDIRRAADARDMLLVRNVQVVTGQEPSDDYDDDFACDFEATVTLGGRTLARFLGVQQRVLETHLRTLTTKQAIAKLHSNPPKELMQQLRSHVRQAVEDLAWDEFQRGATLRDFDFTEFTDTWNAVIDPQAQTVTYSLEVGTYSTWD